jgi:integrase
MIQKCLLAQKCLILAYAETEKKTTKAPCNPPSIGGGVGLAQCIDDVLSAKRRSNKTERYVRSLEHYLKQFAKGRENRAIADFTFTEVEEWLAKYDKPVTRQTWFNRLSTLFAFCVKQGHIPGNPLDRLERITVDQKAPLILTPAQSRELLAASPSVMRPYIVLGMFAGIRPEEITRLDWSQINLETKSVSVQGKTRRRRVVTLEPIAVTHLAKHPLQKGPVAPSNSTVDRWRKKSVTLLGLDQWPQDLLRHTAASYLLALHQNAAKVALRLGNSEKVLMSHYYEPITARDCAEFWSGRPIELATLTKAEVEPCPLAA